jgi:hypothetical protein
MLLKKKLQWCLAFVVSILDIGEAIHLGDDLVVMRDLPDRGA